MQSTTYTFGLISVTSGAIFFVSSGCSLEGLVFDVPDDQVAGESSSSSSGGSMSSSAGSGSSSGSASSSSSSGSASSSSSGSASSSASSSGSVITEDCTNGVDDDNDAMADCDDPKCIGAGYSCWDSQAVPMSWSGPYIVYDGSAAMVPSCPADYPLQTVSGVTGVTASPATCSACACSGANLGCNLGPIVGYFDAACGAPSGAGFDPPAAGACSLAGAMSHAGFIVGAPTVTVGGCQPMGGVASKSPPALVGASLVCGGGKGGVCGGVDGACRPPPPAPFVGHLCIVHKGDANCPAPFTQKHGVIQPANISDSRGCSQCTCTSPDQFSCSATYTLYGDNGCNAGVVDLAANNACQSPGVISVGSYKPTVSYKGACSSTGGGQPVGNVNAPPDTTVCCLP